MASIGQIVSSFTNPILKRELLIGFRSLKLRWILLLYVTVPFIFLCSNWPQDGAYYGGSFIAERLHVIFTSVQYFLIIIVTPIFAAYSLSSEYENKTSDFMWITAISPATVILSKVLAVFILNLMLQLASLSSLSLVFYLGGVEADTLIQQYMGLISMSIPVTAICSYYSLRLKQGNQALIHSYLAFFGLFFLLSLLASVFTIRTMRTPAVSLVLINSLLLVIGFLFFIALIWESYRLSEETLPLAYRPLTPKNKKEPLQRFAIYLAFTKDVLRPIPDGSMHQIIAAQEQHINVLYRAERYSLNFVVCAGTGLMLFGSGDLMIFWKAHLALMAIWLCPFHAISLTVDPSSKTFDALRITLVEPLPYAIGKWIASFKSRIIMTVAGIIYCVVHSFLNPPFPMAFLLAPICWILTLESLALISLALSTLLRKTALAVFGNFLALGFLILYPPVPGTLVQSLLYLLSAASVLALSFGLFYFLLSLRWNQQENGAAIQTS
jgi:ABC-type transport system involved in multi-copper enzyme maturation permease subunit